MAKEGLAPYDIQMPQMDYWRFWLRSQRLRLTEDPVRHWGQMPDDFAGFRRFVRDQVFRLFVVFIRWTSGLLKQAPGHWHRGTMAYPGC